MSCHISGADAWAAGRLAAIPLRALGWVSEFPTAPTALARHVDARIRGLPPEDLSAHRIAADSGYQRDHLNRPLKAETGLTLIRLIDAHRLRLAQAALAKGATVTTATARSGLGDPSYFARWFRRQTGFAPGAWRRAHALRPAQTR